MALYVGRVLTYAVLHCCAGEFRAAGEDGNAGDITTPGPGGRDKPKDDACNGEPDAKRIRALPPCNVCGGKVEAETLA